MTGRAKQCRVVSEQERSALQGEFSRGFVVHGRLWSPLPQSHVLLLCPVTCL